MYYIGNLCFEHCYAKANNAYLGFNDGISNKLSLTKNWNCNINYISSNDAYLYLCSNFCRWMGQ